MPETDDDLIAKFIREKGVTKVPTGVISEKVVHKFGGGRKRTKKPRLDMLKKHEARRQQYRDLIHAGYSVEQIAERLGVTHYSVCEMARKLELTDKLIGYIARGKYSREEKGIKKKC